jgi:hypothetical protein
VYDIVVLVEQAVTDWDARQITALHHDPPEPVHHHVLMPVEDAASRSRPPSAAGGQRVVGTAALSRRVRPRRVQGGPRGQRERAGVVDRRLRRAAEASGELTAIDPLTGSPPRRQRQSAWWSSSPAHIVADLLHVDWTHRARRKLKVPVLHLLAQEEPDWESEAEDQDAQEAREENGTPS